MKTGEQRPFELTAHARAVPERDGRVLRVVYNWTTDPWRVVTAFFDRREGRRS